MTQPRVSKTKGSGPRRAAAPAAAPPPAARTAESPGGPITRDEIARLAHSYWQARGCTGGSPEEDWFRAEEELKKRRAGRRPKSSRAARGETSA
jgi:hypothetical protein